MARLARWDWPDLNRLPRWARLLVRVGVAVAVLALIGQLLVYVHYAVSLLRFPFDYDQGEGYELYDTLLHVRGQWPYQNPSLYPFYSSIYPPVFHLLTAPLVAVFGPQLWTGRLVGFLASLITAGAIAYGVFRATRHGWIAAFSALTFLASNYTFHVGPLFRQQMTMVMFETLAVVILARWFTATPDPIGWTRSRSFWAVLVLLLLAGYTKQLAAATVIAVLAFLFLRGPRRAILTGAGLALVAAGLFAAINAATQGWWFVSIIRANINEYHLEQALGFYRQWGELHAVIAVVALARWLYETYAARLSPYAVWLATALFTGLATGKFGSGESYLITATAAACLLSGIGLARLWQHSAAWPKRASLGLALLIPALYLAQTRLTLHLYTTGPIYGPLARALGVPTGSGYYDSQGYTQLGPRPTRADHAAGWEIVRLIEQARCAELLNGQCAIFSEEAAFLLAANKPVVTEGHTQLVMYEAGLFDPTEELALINRKAFGLVILRAQFYPPVVLQALGASYQPKADITMNGFIYRILEPRP